MAAEATLALGLEGTCVAETELSMVDGGSGTLIIRGHRVEDLAHELSFEQAAALLWTGRISDEFRSPLGAARMAAHRQLQTTPALLQHVDPMDCVRACVSNLEASGDLVEDAIKATGAIAVAVSSWARHQAGQALLEPDPDRGHAEDYLQLLRGEEPPAEAAAALNAYLVTVIDHGLNASTFAARVVASTRSDLISAVTAAVGALKGPLHGGAPGPVLDMLDDIADTSGADEWIRQELDAGRRIMGIGHRVYRVRDPRAAVLETTLNQLPISSETASRRELAHAVEESAEQELARRKPGRRLCANVEFYTAVLLEAIGIPRNLFSPTFAVSRVAGWSAHVMEELSRGRLIRPTSRYIGPLAEKIEGQQA